jgi:hypothetical protein
MLSDSAQVALQNAAASSAMEGMPLTQENIDVICRILEGELSLNDYLHSLKLRSQEK